MLRIDTKICRLLLEIKGNAYFVDCDRQTLGHLCARTLDFRVCILKVLDDYGVDLAKKDCDRRMVLYCAAISSSLTEQSLEFLVNILSIHASERDIYGQTALQYAIELVAKDCSRNTWDSILAYMSTQ